MDAVLVTVTQLLLAATTLLLWGAYLLCLWPCLCHTIRAFHSVEPRVFDSTAFAANIREDWPVGVLFGAAIAMTTLVGYGACRVLAQMDLAHIKSIEYVTVVIPLQFGVGVHLGTILQSRIGSLDARHQGDVVHGSKGSTPPPTDRDTRNLTQAAPA
jgi:hypothetical protein